MTNSTVFAIVAALLLTCTVLGSGELQHDERNDLILLRDSLSSSMSLHSNWTGPPCYGDHSRWFGVSCSNSSVIAVALPGIQLTGSLPSTALQNVSRLVALNLSDNALHGALPSLRGLVHLRSVSFAGNRFSGAIPAEFVALPSLSRLELQDNVLNGTLPSFKQRTLKVFNVSYNFLEGSIPSNSVLQGFPTSSFDHNLGLCGKPLSQVCHVVVAPLPPPPPPPPPSKARPARRAGGGPPPSGTKSSGAETSRPWVLVLAAIGIIGIASMALLCLFYSFNRCTKKAKQKAPHSGSFATSSETAVRSADSSTAQGTKKIVDLVFLDKDKATFDLDDLLRSSAEMIGKGKVGNTFKATLESGQVVIVKRLKATHGMSKKEFVQQMQVLGRLRHDNLVEIISFHYSKEEKFVVYEYVSGGSLFQLLHDNRGGEGRVPLKWAARLNIVKGIARGLAYLHHSMPRQKAPHANLKSSNVLIVQGGHRHSNYHPKLTDGGFLSILPSSQGYRLAIGKVPEFSQGTKLTHKADVYCFGLVALEVITGQVMSDREEDLPGWVKLVVNNDWSTDMLDLEIVGEKESHEEMLKLTEIALHCTELEPGRRPAMSDVVSRIEQIRGTGDGRR